ncbi:MAG: TetR/AcrR family transcriptional regulator [Duncaniella sp.]|nr:TetR/AcrR family transcriptional regulator [Duncaniella sp.]
MNNSVNTSVSTCERILAAAEAEFFSKGFAGARTTSIAEAAGVTHAMLHYYYRTKKHLFEQVIASKAALMKELMLSSLGDTSVPLFERLTACISRHLDFLAANPTLPGFMAKEMLASDETRPAAMAAISAQLPEVIASLQRNIDEYASRGECRKVDARTIVLDILSLNAMPFLLPALVDIISGDGLSGDFERFIARRKQENIETILRKLRP